MKSFEELGQKLKKEREKRNISLEKISKETKIKIAYLKAIEDGMFEKIPGGEVYIKGFIKNYIKTVGLNKKEILQEYYDIKESLKKKSAPEENKEKKKTKPQKTLLIDHKKVAIIFLIVIAVISVVLMSNNNQKEHDTKKTIEHEKNEITEKQNNNETAKANQKDEKTEITPKEKTVKLISDNAQDTKYVVNDSKLKLKLQITSDSSWVKIKTDDELLFEGTLNKGQTKMATASKKIWVRIGNTLVTRIYINHKDLGIPGGNTRNFIFEAQN